MDHGYIKLHRKFFLNTLWKEPREYSRAEAWLDLIQGTRFESSQEVFNGRVIEVRKSEVVASRRYLEKRWGWGSTKVNNFLDFLRKNGMITTRQTGQQTIITLCNFDIYNDAQTSGQTSSKPLTNHRQTTGKPNNKKEKKDNIIIPPNTNVFVPPSLEEVAEYFDQKGYTREAAERAYAYYTERNWVDRNGQSVKNWKSKCIAVWFKPENKKPDAGCASDIVDFRRWIPL